MEPQEFAAWIKGKNNFYKQQQRDKIDIMFVIRWVAGFIVQSQTKKTIRVERYLKLPSDKRTDPDKVMKKQDFESIRKRYDDSANNR